VSIIRQQQLQIIRYLFGHTAVAKLREQGLQRPLAAPIPEALEFLTGAAAEALEDADAGTVEVVANALLHNVLAIPLLPLRLTTEFARVASDLPLATLLPLWLAHLEHPQAAAIPPKKATAVLGNLISLIKIVSQRRLLAYNELVRDLINRLLTLVSCVCTVFIRGHPGSAPAARACECAHRVYREGANCGRLPE